MRSVSQRLLISVTVLLLLFFGVMAEVLDARFRAVAENSLRELLDAGFDGFVMDDHVPHVVEDTVWGHRSRAYATGHIAGILRALRA